MMIVVQDTSFAGTWYSEGNR